MLLISLMLTAALAAGLGSASASASASATVEGRAHTAAGHHDCPGCLTGDKAIGEAMDMSACQTLCLGQPSSSFVEHEGRVAVVLFPARRFMAWRSHDHGPEPHPPR